MIKFIMLDYIYDIEQKMENLKCCGNCEDFIAICTDSSSNKYCKDWKSDNITRKEREA